MPLSTEDQLGMYTALGCSGPIEPRIGRSLISLVDPVAGQAAAYERWYEDEHMVVSALACPGVFAGRRFVATRDLRAMRLPETSAVITPLDRGCFLNIYWILEGHYDAFIAFVRSQVEVRLYPEGRMPPLRKHVFTNDQEYVGACYRDTAGPRDIHALAVPFKGLVVQVIDAKRPEDRPAIEQKLMADILPPLLAGGSWAMCMAFRAMPPAKAKPEIDWYGRRTTLLWFGDASPETGYPHPFAEAAEAIERAGLGRSELIAPFVPLVPGATDHLDKL